MCVVVCLCSGLADEFHVSHGGVAGSLASAKAACMRQEGQEPIASYKSLCDVLAGEAARLRRKVTVRTVRECRC